MAHTLFLASTSSSRKNLLSESRIPFCVIEQSADEAQCDWNLPLSQVVQNIAAYKMQRLVLPLGTQEGQICFVLTADTLSQDKSDNALQGKPVDRADAIDKIKRARAGTRLCTAFCLHKYEWRAGEWHLVAARQECVQSDYLFYVPDSLIDWYLDNSIGMSASNAIAVEGFGSQFLKSVEGSHSAIIGLPLFEVRNALCELGFFDE